MLEQLKIDEEFQTVLPQLTDEEFQQLEQNIINDNEVRNPIIVWNDVIVDGHNRWKILQKHPDIPHRIMQKDFEDRWSVIDWIISTQKGQRNLTASQRTNLIGKLFEARKHKIGNPNQERNPDGTFQLRKNCVNGSKDKSGQTTRQIANEFGVSPRTVDAAFAYSQGIDTIRKEDPNLANDILSGKVPVTHKVVEEIRRSEPEEVKSTIKMIKDGTFRRTPAIKTEKEKADLKDIARRVEMRKTASSYVPELKDLVKDLKINSAPYIRLLNQMITGYKDVIKGNSNVVLDTIKECIEDEIEKIKEKIRNEYA